VVVVLMGIIMLRGRGEEIILLVISDNYGERIQRIQPQQFKQPVVGREICRAVIEAVTVAVVVKRKRKE
jgi:hypothetical protein